MANPSLPPEAHEGVIRGMYLLQAGPADMPQRVQLLGSGAIMGEVLKAAKILQDEHGVAADVWSVTSYAELARDGEARLEAWRNSSSAQALQPGWFAQQLAATQGPVIAASDYVRALPELVRAYLPCDERGLPRQRYYTLGTDGFGRSDSRSALRRHFAVDAQAIVQTYVRSQMTP